MAAHCSTTICASLVLLLIAQYGADHLVQGPNMVQMTLNLVLLVQWCMIAGGQELVVQRVGGAAVAALCYAVAARSIFRPAASKLTHSTCRESNSLTSWKQVLKLN